MAAAAATEPGPGVGPGTLSSPPPASPPPPPLLFAFGAVSDVQHADREDGHNYTQTKTRHYRAALGGLQRAVASWLGEGQGKEEEGEWAGAAAAQQQAVAVAFVLQLGDLLDGFARTTALGSEGTLRRLLGELARLHCPVYHCLGNHEFYNNADRSYWRQALHPQSATAYCAFSPHPRFRFVGLDTYDVSVLGAAPGTPERALAEAALARNPNEDKNSPLGLEGLEQRFVQFGGGVGPAQLAWLDGVLDEAHRANQRVVVFSHVPLHPRVCTPDCLLWNYDDVLACLHRHRGLVALCLAGHCHAARVFRDRESGVVHCTLDSPLEQPDAFSTVFVYENRIEVRGHGANASVVVEFVD